MHSVFFIYFSFCWFCCIYIWVMFCIIVFVFCSCYGICYLVHVCYYVCCYFIYFMFIYVWEWGT